MRLKLLAALIGAGLAAPVLAQSNITIYGIADTGIQVSRFGNGTQYNMASGIADGSRLGFKGTEDIGGGYKAIFTLEARVELDTGSQSNTYLSSGVNQSLTQGLPPLPPAAAAGLQSAIILPPKFVNPDGALFDRQAFVGLITPGGAVLLGRQYTPGFEIHSISDAFETGTGASWGTITTGNGGGFTPGIAIRANNAVQYRLQLPNGVGAAAMYGFEETGSLNLSKRFWGANVKYQANGIDAGIGYNRENDQNSNPSLTTLTAGGSYTLGDAKLFAGFHRMKNDHSVLVPRLTPIFGAAVAGIVGSNATINGNVFTLGAHYRIGAGRIMAGVSRFNDKKAANGDANLYGLGYDYNLSKRTDVYTVVSHVTNQNAAQYAIGGAGYSGGSTTQPGQDANALQIGIRHKF